MIHLQKKPAWQIQLARFIALVACFFILLGSAGRYSPRTKQGVHCPTATTQAVTQVIEEKTCCGTVIKKVVVRKPMLGESDFKQCLCAEKKSAQSSSEAVQKDTSSGKIAVGLPLERLVWAEVPVLPNAELVMPTASLYLDPISPPGTPPPDQV